MLVLQSFSLLIRLAAHTRLLQHFSAHFKCIVEYAKKKSLELDRMSDEDISCETFTLPWLTCSNCNQHYNNALSINLMDSLLPFTKRSFPCHPAIKCPAFPCDPTRYAEALEAKGDVYSELRKSSLMGDTDRAYYREEAKKINSETLAVIGKMKAHPYIYDSRTVPDHGVIAMEAGSHETIALCIVEGIMLDGLDKKEMKSVWEHFRKSRALFESIGRSENVTAIDQKVAQSKKWFEGTSMNGSIKALYESYEEDPKNETAAALIMALRAEHRIIECERVISEHLVLVRRIHGPNHAKTRSMEEELEDIRDRKVLLKADRGIYHAIRYEDDGKKCVLWGPWAQMGVREEDTRWLAEEEKRNITIDADKLILLPGTPVVCHGLKNASHLNGKIGDARSFNEDIKRWSVHFENKRLKPCLVKPENLRIVFGLPPKVD